MAPLPGRVKVEIVVRMACCFRYAEIARHVKEEFGIELTRQQLQRYDPETANGRSLRPELKALYERTRRRFLEELEKIPLAHRGYRLRQIQRLYDRCRDDDNPRLAMKLLEMTAKEMGGYYDKRGRRGNRCGEIPYEVPIFA